jgi:hypothetical protein
LRIVRKTSLAAISGTEAPRLRSPDPLFTLDLFAPRGSSSDDPPRRAGRDDFGIGFQGSHKNK